MNIFFRNVAGFCFGLMLLVSAGFAVPQPAHAQLLTFDPVDILLDFLGGIEQFIDTLLEGEGFSKEYILDPIAWIASKAALQSMTESALNWAGSGYGGSPGFVTDIRAHMLAISDEVATDFLNQYRSSGAVNSPFRDSLAASLQQNYLRTTAPDSFDANNAYTLDETCPNHESFLQGNFSSGGFSCWIQALTRPSNNPLGAFNLAQGELARQTSETRENRERELGWANGFLPWCGDAPSGSEGESEAATGDESGEGGSTGESEAATTNESSSSVSLTASTGAPANCSAQTLGSVLSHAVNKLGVDVGADINVTADELDETLMNLLANIMMDQIFGGGGLAGGSAGSARPGGVGTTTDASVNGMNAFLTTITNQRIRVEEYKQAWERLQTVILQAEAHVKQCTSEAAKRVYDNEIVPLVAKAEDSLEKADAALLLLDDYTEKIQDPNLTAAEFDAIFRDHTLAQRDGRLPTAQEIIFATRESMDIPPPSTNTYSKMKAYSTQLCSQIGASGS